MNQSLKPYLSGVYERCIGQTCPDVCLSSGQAHTFRQSGLTFPAVARGRVGSSAGRAGFVPGGNARSRSRSIAVEYLGNIQLLRFRSPLGSSRAFAFTRADERSSSFLSSKPGDTIELITDVKHCPSSLHSTVNRTQRPHFTIPPSHVQPHIGISTHPACIFLHYHLPHVPSQTFAPCSSVNR